NSLFALDPEVKQVLSSYLRRLRNTQDYRAGDFARQNVILRVERMLQLANTNPAFRNEMLAVIHEGLGTCGDRVTLIFNEIEILWQLNQENLPPPEFRNLAIGAERCRRLQLHAEQKAQELSLGDPIEAILYYQVHLKNDLQLPISTQTMLYPGVSGVTQAMLAAAKDEILAISDEELLATSKHWQNYVKLHHEQQ